MTGSFANGAGSIVAVTCPAAPSCSWVTSGTGINAGDSLIWTSNNGAGGNAPLTLSFTAELGAGLWLQADAVGQYTAEIQAFNGSTSLLAQTVTSDSAGDPVFLGVLDTVREVTSVTYSLTAVPFGGDVNDFAADKLLLKTPVSTTTPEPAAFWLFAAILPVLAWRGRRRLSAQFSSLTSFSKGLV